MTSKTRARLLLVAALAGAAVILAGWRLRWRELAPYSPPEIVFAAPFRTMAEHDEVMRDREWPYVLELGGESGAALLYYGSWHTQDPDDPQIAEIRERFAAFRPTVALTENRLGFLVGPLALGVRVFGEFACAWALARGPGIPVYTLEPTWEVEVREMKAAFPVEEVTLFYTLRVFLGERGGATGEEREALAAHLLAKRGSRPGLEGSLSDLAAVDRLWDERFADLGPWRELPPEAVHPSSHPTRLQRLANHVNELRDRHAAAVILDLLARGERVFAISGGSHVVKQEPAIAAGLAALAAGAPLARE